MRHCNNAVFAALLAGATLALGAQEKLVASTPEAVPRTVVLSISVTDSDNRVFAGLGQDSFSIYENDRPQQIATFAKTDEPFTVGIIVDLSGSMASKLNRAGQAILRFIQTANPRDKFFVVGFSDQAVLFQDFTQSTLNIQSQLAAMHAGHRTALMDAISFALTKMKEVRSDRKVLLIVSDGGENRSQISEGKLREEARKADVEICSIGIFDPYSPTPEERSGPQLLDELSEDTGGRLVRVDDMAKLVDVAETMSTGLRNQYLVSYSPSDPALDGKWRKVKVKINPSPALPRLKVHARSGYYAPLQ
jgi:Ca-activated chloride channel family protein